jgi:hypothetical protein
VSEPVRRVLLISFAYPPIGGAGMIRPAKFAKYLPEFGFLPTVLTPERGAGRFACAPEAGEFPGVTVCRTPYEDVITRVKARFGMARLNAARLKPCPTGGGDAAVGQGFSLANQQAGQGFPPSRCPETGSAAARPRRSSLEFRGTKAGRLARSIRAALYAAITIPDEHVGWLRHAVTAGRELLQRDRYDVIFSTSPPETTHLIARRLKREFNIPWVADLRDLWSGDHYRRRHPVKRRVLKVIERRVLRDADAIVTVSEPWREALARDHGSDRVVCLPHGFDPDDYPTAPPPASTTFVVSYMGSLDREFQDPTPFLEAAGDLVRSGEIPRECLRIDFYVFGDDLPDFAALTARFGLDGVVTRHASVEYRESLARQQASTVLLALQWQSEAGKGNPPLKVFDYLGARRPILVVGSGEHVLGPLMQDTGSGVVCGTPMAIRETLGRWYREFAETGRVRWPGSEDRLARHTRRAAAKALAGIMEQVPLRVSRGGR